MATRPLILALALLLPCLALAQFQREPAPVPPAPPAAAAEIVEVPELPTLRPTPVPLRVRVVLVGPPELYAALIEADADFAALFRIKAEVEASIPRTPRSCTASSRTRTPRPQTPMAVSSAGRPPAPTCR